MKMTHENLLLEGLTTEIDEGSSVKAIISCELKQSGLWIRAIIIFQMVLCVNLTIFYFLHQSMILGLIVAIPITCLFVYFYYLIINRKRKLTELIVTENKIVGSYTAFMPFAKIMLRMPIEKIDNVVAVNSVFDFFTGKKNTHSFNFRVY